MEWFIFSCCTRKEKDRAGEGSRRDRHSFIDPIGYPLVSVQSRPLPIIEDRGEGREGHGRPLPPPPFHHRTRLLRFGLYKERERERERKSEEKRERLREGELRVRLLSASRSKFPPSFTCIEIERERTKDSEKKIVKNRERKRRRERGKGKEKVLPDLPSSADLVRSNRVIYKSNLDLKRVSLIDTRFGLITEKDCRSTIELSQSEMISTEPQVNPSPVMKL